MIAVPKDWTKQKLDCYCTQEYLSLIYEYEQLPKRTSTNSEMASHPARSIEALKPRLTSHSCESKIQQCLASHLLDNQFDAKIEEWHSDRDSRVSSTMTTHALPTITQTYDLGPAVASIKVACEPIMRQNFVRTSTYLYRSFRNASTTAMYHANELRLPSRIFWATHTAPTSGPDQSVHIKSGQFSRY